MNIYRIETASETDWQFYYVPIPILEDVPTIAYPIYCWAETPTNAFTAAAAVAHLYTQRLLDELPETGDTED